MRRIALVSEHASPLACAGGVDSGGQNVYVAQVARQLARAGWHVDVFTRRDRSLLPMVMQWQPRVRIIHVPAGPPEFIAKEKLLPAMTAFSSFLLNFIRCEKNRYDILHANFFMSGLAALDSSRQYRIPLIMTFHALGRVRRLHQCEADGFPDARFEIEDELVRTADRIIAECPQDREDLLSLYDADPSRIDVVPCGFDPEELRPMPRQQARAELGWPQDEMCILQLGRLVPRKGVDNAIRGLAGLHRRYGLPARLYIVGGASEAPNAIATPEIARLTRIAQDCGVADRVHFIGRRGRSVLARYYSAADVFVSTPTYEPFGITPLEAMSCGTPVIGSAVGGIRSTVIDGETGFLVPPDDPDTLADRLGCLHMAPMLRREFGEAGRARVHQQYTWRHVANRLIDVYESVLSPVPQARWLERAAIVARV